MREFTLGIIVLAILFSLGVIGYGLWTVVREFPVVLLFGFWFVGLSWVVGRVILMWGAHLD